MSPNDNTGLGLFDEAASAAGNFPGALRGYDRQAVDDYVRTLEASVVQSRRHAAELEQQVGGLQDRLSQSQAREGNPEDVDYSDLGGRASDILRLAQEQAHDLTNLANVEAERTREEARREAAAVRERADAEAEELRSSGLGDVDDLRTRLQDQVRTQVARAQAEAAALVDAARREGEALRRQATHEADAVRQDAQLDAETLRRSAEREVAEMRAALAQEREHGLARYKVEHDELSALTQALLEEAAEHHAQSTGRLEADIAESARLRAEAIAEAEDVRSAALAEAENRVVTARKQATAISERTQQEFSWRKQQLRRETELLQQRKQAVLSQLASLSALAEQTASAFPDLDETRADDGSEPRQTYDESQIEVEDAKTVLKTSPGLAGPSEDSAVATAETQEVSVDGDPTVLARPGQAPAGIETLEPRQG